MFSIFVFSSVYLFIFCKNKQLNRNKQINLCVSFIICSMNRFKKVYEDLLELNYVSTQQEFSERVGIARTIVSQLLNDKRELSDKQIQKICRVFPFVNEKWLLDGTGDIYLATAHRPNSNEEEESNAYYDSVLAEKEAYQAELERKASLYDSKSQEVVSLYSQLAETMNRLHEKEKEIADLHSVIQSQIQTIRFLRKPLESTEAHEDAEAGAKEGENT